ncbi:alpha/beta hydrolase [Brumimicrobium sp.]|uniref:alpha/beta hydrolase n=1 Tax=Brumimicrobium sp. TaxID=2029867 RepID=UPI003A8CB89B
MEGKITISKTVRYFTHGNPDTAENIWLVLHGYSQLPKFFIRKFQALDPEKNFVVAPEGMHRFYRKGTQGRVGASWMTKEARLDDIEDNHKYLDKLAEHLLKGKSYKQRYLLGFSQGGATATRWHQRGSYNADHFILWASVFPEDVSIDEEKSGMLNSNNYFVVGKSDPYFEGKLDEVQSFFEKQDFQTTVKIFDGHHDMDTQTLLEIANECE